MVGCLRQIHYLGSPWTAMVISVTRRGMASAAPPPVLRAANRIPTLRSRVGGRGDEDCFRDLALWRKHQFLPHRISNEERTSPCFPWHSGAPPS